MTLCSTRFYTSLLPIVFCTLSIAQPMEIWAMAADTTARNDTSSACRLKRIGDTAQAYLRTPIPSKPLSWKAVVVPALLVSYGTFSFTSEWGKNINVLGQKWALDDDDPDSKTHLDDYTLYVPAVAVLGLNLAGVRGKNNLIDATFLYGLSSGIANSIVVPLKRFAKEQRPDSSDALSFPSGHTTTAFVSAEFLRQEYKDISPWIGAAGYGCAIITGYLRMYNNKHWFSDVIAGAGVGIISTRVSYWLYPKMKNWVLGKSAGSGSSATIILPTYGAGYFGFSAVHRF